MWVFVSSCAFGDCWPPAPLGFIGCCWSRTFSLGNPSFGGSHLARVCLLPLEGFKASAIKQCEKRAWMQQAHRKRNRFSQGVSRLLVVFFSVGGLKCLPFSLSLCWWSLNFSFFSVTLSLRELPVLLNCQFEWGIHMQLPSPSTPRISLFILRPLTVTIILIPLHIDAECFAANC